MTSRGCDGGFGALFWNVDFAHGGCIVELIRERDLSTI